MFPCELVHKWFWSAASGCSGVGGRAQKCCQDCLFHRHTIRTRDGYVFLTPIIFVFGLGIPICPRIDHLVFSPSLKWISLPPHPHPGFFNSTCLCLLLLLLGICSHSASQLNPASCFCPVPLLPWSLFHQGRIPSLYPSSPSPGRREPTGINGSSLWSCGLGVISWLCHFLAGGAWSAIETPCPAVSVSNSHPLRILWEVNTVNIDIQDLNEGEAQGIGVFHFIPSSEILSHCSCHSLTAWSCFLLPWTGAFMFMFYLALHWKPKCTCAFWAALYSLTPAFQSTSYSYYTKLTNKVKNIYPNGIDESCGCYWWWRLGTTEGLYYTFQVIQFFLAVFSSSTIPYGNSLCVSLFLSTSS